MGAAFIGAAFIGAAFIGAAFIGAAFIGAARRGAAFIGAALRLPGVVETVDVLLARTAFFVAVKLLISDFL